MMAGIEGAPLWGSRRKVKHHCGFWAKRIGFGHEPTLRNAPLLLLPLALSACMIPTGPVEVTRFNRAAEGVVYGKRQLSVTPR
jgi:hypothetical protein